MQGPIELPPLIITPTNRPTQHRPGWGTHWIPHPSGTQFPAIPHAIAPPGKPARTPAVNPAVSAADKIQASFKKITPTEFGKTKKQIEALIAAQLKTSIYRNLKAATRKQYIVEDLLILRLDQGAAADKIAKKWLGYSIESRPNRVNVANYEKRYGKPQKDIELFKQRFTESYRAVAAKAQSMVEYFHLYTQVATSPTDKIRARHRAQHAAAAKAEAARVAAAKAKAEADRIAAAKAKAEADRIAAANTYAVSGSVASAGSVFITAAGHLRTAVTYVSVGRVLTTAVGALIGFAGSVAVGLVAGVSALIYSPRLGNGELPARYALQTPLTDLDPLLSAALPSISSASHVDLPFRLSSRVTKQNESEIFVVKTDGVIVPSRVPVLSAQYDAQHNVYTATTADIPPRTLTWTPIVTPGNASTTLPPEQPEPSIYEGAKLEPVEVRIDSFPEVADASWDDYVIVFPADSGLPPIYTMFRDRRAEPGVASGHGVEVDGTWANLASTREGAPVPRQIAAQLSGREFKSWKAYRQALWKAVSNDAFLSSQFDLGSIGRMKRGFAPLASEPETVGKLATHQIHHRIPISINGDVFNADNLVILTPRQHIEIHKIGIKL